LGGSLEGRKIISSLRGTEEGLRRHGVPSFFEEKVGLWGERAAGATALKRLIYERVPSRKKKGDLPSWKRELW